MNDPGTPKTAFEDPTLVLEEIKFVYEVPRFEVKIEKVFYNCEVFDTNHEPNQVEIIVANTPQSISVLFEDVYYKRQDISESLDIRVGLKVEVFLQAKNTKQGGWHTAVIKLIKDSACLLQMCDGRRTPCFTIGQLENLRSPTSSATLSQDAIQKYIVTIPENVCSYFKENPKSCQVLNKYIRAITIRAISASELLVISDYKNSSKYMTLLADYYFKGALELHCIAKTTSEVKRKLKRLKKVAYVEEVSVPSDLVRYAIGKEENNIRKAENVKGVIHIEFDNTATFKIFGKNQKSVIKARRILNFTMETVQVPKSVIGQIIGGSTIQKFAAIADVSIEIWKSEKYFGMEEYFEMDIIGTKSKIDDAKWLIEARLEFLKLADLEFKNEKADIDRFFKAQLPRTARKNPAATPSTAQTAPSSKLLETIVPLGSTAETAQRLETADATAPSLSRTYTLSRPKIEEAAEPRSTESKTRCRSWSPEVAVPHGFRWDPLVVFRTRELAVANGYVTDRSRKPKTVVKLD